MKVAIVGGGWAGLSAAVTAVRLGHQVRLFEAAPTLGGRARSVHSPTLAATIDNGQHLLLGAYTATLALMRELGLDPALQFMRTPLGVRSADDTFRMHALPGLPAPLHIAAGLLGAKGLTWKEKRAVLRAMTLLRGNDWKIPHGATVQEWLSLALQPVRLQKLLWHPLCIATMNTPADQACAQLFAHVLRDSLGAAGRAASDMLIPRTTLTELWPARVEELALAGGLADLPDAALDVQCSSSIRGLRYVDECSAASHINEQGHEKGARLEFPVENSSLAPFSDSPDTGMRPRRPLLALDDRPEYYDAVLLCSNTPSTARLLATLPPTPDADVFLDGLRAFEHAPIATLTLELTQALALPAPMLLLHEDRQRGHYGQWLFQGQDAGKRLLHIVVSDADALLQRERGSAVEGIIGQLREQLRGVALPPVARHALIIEKRATFLAVPGLQRPGNRTPWSGVWVAGDWTDTGYPAVLEGAVRSGRDAALAMHAAFEDGS